VPILADSYMGVFMPADLPRRVMEFMAGRTGFPFIKRDELIGIFYLFGKDQGVPEAEVAQASGLAQKTAERVAADIRLYRMTPAKLEPAFTRQNYTKRSLQVVVDSAGDFTEVDRRVAADPAILADCFAQHVSHYHQDFFFELFGPIESGLLPENARTRLAKRMVLIGCNAKDRKALPYPSPLEPFIQWIGAQKDAGAAR